MFGFIKTLREAPRTFAEDNNLGDECEPTELHFISRPAPEVFLGIVEDETTGERLKAFFHICDDCGGGDVILKDLHK